MGIYVYVDTGNRIAMDNFGLQNTVYKYNYSYGNIPASNECFGRLLAWCLYFKDSSEITFNHVYPLISVYNAELKHRMQTGPITIIFEVTLFQIQDLIVHFKLFNPLSISVI